VITCLKLKSGATFYTNLTISEARTAITNEIEISVWWFAAWGQRFSEKLYIADGELAYMITESDDG